MYYHKGKSGAKIFERGLATIWCRKAKEYLFGDILTNKYMKWIESSKLNPHVMSPDQLARPGIFAAFGSFQHQRLSPL